MTFDATCDRYYQRPAQVERPGSRTWITRGANFVVAVTAVQRGTRLQRLAEIDESMVYLPDGQATIEARGDRVVAGPESLTIVPPGDSEVVADDAGHVVRIFTARAADLVALAENLANYADGAAGVAPLHLWPDPPDGFRLRHYRASEFDRPDSNMRLFRCTGLMINLLKRRDVPRDVRKLSPHAHPDFEQGSLAVEGTYLHHLRWPWVPDMTAWREDVHVTMASPSLLVVPPGVVHTSMNVTPVGRLVDIFAPPRLDFSARPGLVCNAEEYPVPPDADLSAYASGSAA